MGWYLAKKGIVDAKAKKVSTAGASSLCRFLGAVLREERLRSVRARLTRYFPSKDAQQKCACSCPSTLRAQLTASPSLPAVNTSLFTPCLLFNKVAFSLTPDKLAELYIIPIGFCLVSAFSAGVAYLLGRVAGLKKGQRDFASASRSPLP